MSTGDRCMRKHDIVPEENDDIFDGEWKNIVLYEHDVFETADNAPDCCELLALFSVYRFLFLDDFTKNYFDK